MRKVIRANSKCPLCGCEAYTAFLAAECTNSDCTNHKEGVVTKSEYDFLDLLEDDDTSGLTDKDGTLFDNCSGRDDQEEEEDCSGCDDCDCDGFKEED